MIISNLSHMEVVSDAVQGATIPIFYPYLQSSADADAYVYSKGGKGFAYTDTYAFVKDSYYYSVAGSGSTSYAAA